MKKDEIISLLRASYDKLILIVVLAVILLSLLILILSAGREKKSLADDQWEPALKRSGQRNDKSAAAVFCNAIEAVAAPFQLGRTTRMVVAELRVNCVKCGRPIPGNAEKCPFRDCLAPQPKITSPEARDSDFDSLPDEWETRHGLNANLDDAGQDADNDGFANLEEFKAGTDPTNPVSAPPPVSKLRVLKVVRVSFPLTFGGAQQTHGGTLSFQVKNKRTRTDNFVRIGDTVDGYKVTGYEKKTVKVNRGIEIEEDVSVLKVTRDGKTFELTVGDKGIAQGELAAELIYLIDNAKTRVKKDDVISLKNNRYKVIDIAGQNVTVADMQSGEEIPLEPFAGADK